MRVLAVDYGQKRVGLAISDALEITANPLCVLERKGDLSSMAAVAARVAAIVAAEGAEELVVGLPLNTDGSRGPAAELAQRFADLLAAQVRVPVRLHDEHLSTTEAHERMGAARSAKARARRRGTVDQVAAAVILRDYLGTRRRGLE